MAEQEAKTRSENDPGLAPLCYLSPKWLSQACALDLQMLWSVKPCCWGTLKLPEAAALADLGASELWTVHSLSQAQEWQVKRMLCLDGSCLFGEEPEKENSSWDLSLLPLVLANENSNIYVQGTTLNPQL